MARVIRFRVSVSPAQDDGNFGPTFWCDIECTEEDLQKIDEDRQGFEDFVEKFFHPAICLLTDEFQQRYETAEELLEKSIANGGPLPRSIEFYREKMAMRMKRSNARA